MPDIQANGITIEYESIGDPAAEPLLLVMGLGAQLILWHDEFCAMLAERGYHVLRFDNRDVGLSTKITGAGVPDLAATMAAAFSGQPVAAPYTLSDMAADAAGLLDGLGIDSAHVMGASMGGMIAQTMAIEHPERVRTLTSIMSTTGRPDLPPARPEAISALLTPPPPTREGNIERGLAVFRVIGSPGFPFDEDRVRDLAGRAFDRGFHPEGVIRQLTAILASGSRRERLATWRRPTLVIHGKDDPLVPLEGGLDTAEAIPGARLDVIEGMGHDMPREIWARIVDGFCNLARAEAAA